MYRTMAMVGVKSLVLIALVLLPLTYAGPDGFNFVKVPKFWWPVRWSAKFAASRCNGFLWQILWAGGYNPVSYPWIYNWYKLYITIRRPPFLQRWHCRVYVHLPPPFNPLWPHLDGNPPCKCTPIL